VQEVNMGNRELIQNGNFSGGTAATWRLLGNHGGHGRSVVVDDPAALGNKVLKMVATGPTEHMHNHAETTVKVGATYPALSSASTYTISFRARWVSGSPRLHTRLYFNRAARQHLSPVPRFQRAPPHFTASLTRRSFRRPTSRAGSASRRETGPACSSSG
jgi:hypothetical protein